MLLCYLFIRLFIVHIFYSFLFLFLFSFTITLLYFTLDLRRSQSSVGTPPRVEESQFTFKNTTNENESNNNGGVGNNKINKSGGNMNIINKSGSGGTNSNKNTSEENKSIIPDSNNPSSNRGHRAINSDASSLDFNFDDPGLSPSSFSTTHLCIQQLGSIGAEILTGNQKQSIVELCNLLMGGILVLKHSRSGKPSLRTLYCDESLTTLYWSEVGKIVDGRGDILFDASGLYFFVFIFVFVFVIFYFFIVFSFSSFIH